jgi:pimeloyl-ACP methyl ester carboxylesterase
MAAVFGLPRIRTPTPTPLRLGASLAPRESVAAGLAYGDWLGAGPPIVLVPGIFSSHRGLSALAVALSKGRRSRHRRVVAFDLRGRGRTGPSGPFGIEQHARDLWRAIDALGLERPVLCGHSLGAFVAAVAACSRPGAAAGLALLDGGLWSPAPVPVELVHAIFADDRARLDLTFPDVRAYAVHRGLEPTDDVLDELINELAPSDGGLSPVMPAQAFDEDVASIATDERRNRHLSSAGCPALVIRARRGVGGDPLVQMVDDATLDAALAELPSLRVVDLADASHGELVRAPFAKRVAAEISALPA